MLKESREHLGDFLSKDEKGKILPEFYFQLEELLWKEHSQLKESTEMVLKSTRKIKDIIVTQNKYTQTENFIEEVAPAIILTDVLSIKAESLKKAKVIVDRDFLTVLCLGRVRGAKLDVQFA